MRSFTKYVTASNGDSLGRVVLFGKTFYVYETSSNALLGMYDVRHP